MKFHDGSKLTAEDVAYSVQRIIDPKFASPQLGQFDQITKAEATGPNVVTLTTKSPYPALLAQLVKLSIVPKKIVEEVGKDAFNLKPVGSGPYKFDGWQRGVAVTLTRNDDYWGTKGPFASVIFRAVPDAATRVADLQTGTADLAVSLDSDQAAQLKAIGQGAAAHCADRARRLPALQHHASRRSTTSRCGRQPRWRSTRKASSMAFSAASTSRCRSC